MHELVSYFERELPRVNDELDACTSRLHPLVKPMADHVLQAGGKRLRPILTLLTAKGLGYTGNSAYNLACAMELFHSATLLHDDILDSSQLRRGVASAHTIFGETKTILTGDALLALGNQLVAEYGIPELSLCISEGIVATVTGEIVEIDHTRNVAIDESTYLEIITGKTAYLIKAACKCGAILAGASPEQINAAGEYGLKLGIAFQLIDDCLDYASSAEKTGKPVATDLLEGKLTLPFLYFFDQADTQTKADIAAKIKDNLLKESDIAVIVQTVRDGGYDRRTKEMAQAYLDGAQQALEVFPQSAERGLLEKALEYVLRRER